MPPCTKTLFPFWTAKLVGHTVCTILAHISAGLDGKCLDGKNVDKLARWMVCLVQSMDPVTLDPRPCDVTQYLM